MKTVLKHLPFRGIVVFNLLAAMIFSLFLGSCQAPPNEQPEPTVSALTGGVLATFSVQNERFRIWVTNPETIRQLQALEAGNSEAKVPNGKLLSGPGQGDHNAPWRWHLDPQDIKMTVTSEKDCDVAPTTIEEDLDEYIKKVGRYCPSGAELLILIDYR
ncbi:MAG: hypothetical protein P8074_17870 [Anaerolineales bacterium]|jgi:hypothetical protein